MYTLINYLVLLLKKVVPESIVQKLRPHYHKTLSLVMACAYGFPARKLTVIGITGTKGKSSTADMLFAILRKAGHSTALISTIRFAINSSSEPNLYKMTLQGRGFAQAFMRRALRAGCTHLIIEVTSESVLQYRHTFLDLDGLIVTNIQREHIESHGSFEKYIAAKRIIVDTLVHSPKKRRVLVMNKEVSEIGTFTSVQATDVISFATHELQDLHTDASSVSFTYAHTPFTIPIPGEVTALNALAAIKMAESLGIPATTSAKALAILPVIRGRLERIEEGQNFLTVVDYAHTPDSLRALYDSFSTHRKICVLGSTGGGRDTWKRPEMGRIADESCDTVILTNEDPYDEDPRKIIDMIARDMQRSPEIIMDRREAIRRAISLAKPGDAVLISGKGTDPYIMGARGTKTPWNDAQVVREELAEFRSRL